MKRAWLAVVWVAVIAFPAFGQKKEQDRVANAGKVMQEIVNIPDEHLVRWWEDDSVATLPEILRMAVGQIGVVPLDAERLKRPHVLRERPRATEVGVDVVDVLDHKHG